MPQIRVLGWPLKYSVLTAKAQEHIATAFTKKLRAVHIPWILNFICCFTWMWSLVLCPKGKARWKSFGNKILGKIFSPKRWEVTKDGENCIIRILIIYITCPRSAAGMGEMWN
jgi:hypothetical protein